MNSYESLPVTAQRGTQYRKLGLGVTAVAAIGCVAFLSSNNTATPIDESDLINEKYFRTWNGDWGDWRPWVSAPAGYAVCGASVRYEWCHDCDDTAANGLEYTFCHKDNWDNQVRKTVEPGNWGSWGTMKMCSQGKYVSNMKVRYEDHIDGDDSALNGLIIYCRRMSDFGGGESITVENGKWGTWKGWMGEQTRYFFTGSRVRYEAYQNRGDDTAWNGIENESKPFNDKTIHHVDGYWDLVGSGGGNTSKYTHALTKSVTTSTGSTLSSSDTSSFHVGVNASFTIGGEIIGGSVSGGMSMDWETSQTVTRETNKQLSYSTQSSCTAECESNGVNIYMFQWTTRALTTTDKLNLRTCHYRCSTSSKRPRCAPQQNC